MRISHCYQFVFLAFPRTGSTSIRKLLDPYSDIQSQHITEIDKQFPFYHHIPAYELKQIFEDYGWDWGDYQKFCVVRNPFDRVVSLYHFIRKINSGYNPDRSFLHNMKKRVNSMFKADISFKEFVERIDPQAGLSRSLESFITDRQGNILVNDILKFEDLNGQLPLYVQNLGLPHEAGNLPHLNMTSSRKHYRKYYDNETRELVENLYLYEIHKFGYKF